MRLYIGFLNYQIIQKSRLHIEVLEHLWKIKSSFKNDLIKDRLFVNDFEEKSLQNIQMTVGKVNYELELTYKIIKGSKEISSHSND